MSWFKKEKTESVKDYSPKKGDKMRFAIDALEENRHDYHFHLIISLIGGSHNMFMGVINLSPVKPYYGYYGIDDTIVYYDNFMRDALLKEGIASYKGSGDVLIITTDKDRVNNLKRELKIDEK